jgi:uncharacterized protein YqeY
MLQEKIEADLKTAIKNQSEEKSLLRVIIGEFNRFGKTLSDDEATKIIKKMKENAIEMHNQSEIDILDRYLPQMLSTEDLSIAIENIITENGIVDIKGMGIIMGKLKQKYPNQYDGKLASEIIRKHLQ